MYHCTKDTSLCEYTRNANDNYDNHDNFCVTLDHCLSIYFSLYTLNDWLSIHWVNIYKSNMVQRYNSTTFYKGTLIKPPKISRFNFNQYNIYNKKLLYILYWLAKKEVKWEGVWGRVCVKNVVLLYCCTIWGFFILLKTRHINNLATV